MSETTPVRDNTINEAIGWCEVAIKAHRRTAGTLMIILGIVLGIFAFSFYYTVSLNNHNAVAIGSYVKRVDSLQADLAETQLKFGLSVQQFRAVVDSAAKIPFMQKHAYDSNSFIGSLIVFNNRSESSRRHYDEVIRGLQSTNESLDKDIVPLDKSVLFIFYGVLIFAIGLLTSFYRFQIKEIAKYEQSRLALSRIRIAGNNYQNGFADIVRQTLVKEAFAHTAEPLGSKKGKIDSPIPGHPTADLATLLINKIFESVEFKAVSKNPSEGQ
jgi:hypothetical protein